MFEFNRLIAKARPWISLELVALVGFLLYLGKLILVRAVPGFARNEHALMLLLATLVYLELLIYDALKLDPFVVAEHVFLTKLVHGFLGIQLRKSMHR